MRQTKILPFLFAAALAGGCGPGDGSTGEGGSTGSGTSTSSHGTSTSTSSGSTSTGGTGGSITQVPKVVSTTPLDGATNVHLNASVSAVFDQAMDPATITTSTFTVTAGGVAIPGAVTYGSDAAVFLPTATFAPNQVITATITTGAKSAGGVALAAHHVWSFTSAAGTVSGLPVKLATAANYVVLAKSGISTVSPSTIVGDVGLSPAAASYVTGFSLTLSAAKTYSTSAQVTGKIYAPDYMPPTPAVLTTAVGDMQLAFTDAAGRAADVTELGAGNIGGKTLAPGVYKWGTGLLIPTDVTLAGAATDVWIFQVAKDLTVSNGTKVVLSGGAVAKNVFWEVAGLVSIGTTAHCEGVILTKTAITLKTGSSINGRLFAQTAVNLASSTIVEPAP